MNRHDQHTLKSNMIRILLPVTRTERCFRVFRLLSSLTAKFDLSFIILNVIEPKHLDDVNDAYQDLNQLAASHLPAGSYTIVIKHGIPGKVISAYTRTYPLDLVILPFTGFTPGYHLSRFQNINDVLRRSHIPILFIPDPLGGNNINIPFSNGMIIAPKLHKATQTMGYALKFARTLADKCTLLVSNGRLRTKRLKDDTNFIMNRYLNIQIREKFRTVTCRKITLKKLKMQALKTNQDLMIIAETARFPHNRFLWLAQVRKMLSISSSPVLVSRKVPLLFHLEKKFRKIFSKLSDYELTDLQQSQSRVNLHDSGIEMTGSELFMGAYSLTGIQVALQRYGLIEDMARIGYTDIRLDLDTRDRFQHRLRIFDVSESKTLLLVDLVLKMQPAATLKECQLPRHLQTEQLLSIEWLHMQDPLRKLPVSKDLFPGQDYPGLGLGWKVLFILKLMAERIGAAALCNQPEYYHTGRFFHRFFHFANPETEAQLMAIDRDTYPCQISEISWAIFHQAVEMNIDDSWKPFRWSGGLQILPISMAMHHMFNSRSYRLAISEHLKNIQFRVNLEKVKILKAKDVFYQMPGDKP
ncbi:universal stress protein [bacterium]|nr:universal stress protein [candidate division CSSED10-310 bacterium]